MSRSMPDKPRVLMLTARHNPFDGRIFHFEAKTLVEAGFEVTIVAPRAGGEPVERDGVRFLPFEKAPKGVARKLSTLKALAQAATRLAPDVLHVHEVDAPLLAGWWAKRRLARKGRRARLVYDCHEPWPFFYARNFGERGLLHHGVKHAVIAYESWMLRHGVDGVLTAHDLEADYLRFLEPRIPVRTSLNTPPLDAWPDTPPVREGPIEVIGHEGYMTEKHGLKTLLGAFERLAREHPRLRLLIAGKLQYPSDEEYFRSWLLRTNLQDRVEYPGWVQRDDLWRYLDRMDIGIHATGMDANAVRVWPANKIMAYLSRGLPIVSTPHPMNRAMFARYGCGVVADGGGPEALGDAIGSLIDSPERARKMGAAGWKLAKDRFDPAQSRRELLALYEELFREETRTAL